MKFKKVMTKTEACQIYGKLIDYNLIKISDLATGAAFNTVVQLDDNCTFETETIFKDVPVYIGENNVLSNMYDFLMLLDEVKIKFLT